MIPAVITATLAKHWRWFALGAAALACWIGFQIIQSRLSDANRKLDTAVQERAVALDRLNVSNASVGALRGEIDKQNQAIVDLGTEGAKRQAEGEAAILAEVRRGAAANAAAAKLIAQPSIGGDQSRSSAAVMAMRNNL